MGERVGASGGALAGATTTVDLAPIRAALSGRLGCELQLDGKLDGLRGSAVLPVADTSEQHFGSAAAQCSGVVSDDGKGNGRQIRELERVEADQTDLRGCRWVSGAESHDGSDGSNGVAIVRREDGRRWKTVSEQLGKGPLGASSFLLFGPDEMLVDGHMVVSVSTTISFEAALPGENRSPGAEVCDPAMAFFDHPAGGLVCAADVVDEHGVDVESRHGPGCEDDRNVAKGSGMQVLSMGRIGRYDDEALDPSADEVGYELLLQLRILIGVSYDDSSTGLGCNLLDSALKFRVVGVRDIGDRYPDQARSVSRSEATGVLIAPIAQLESSALHSLAKLRPYFRPARQNSRHRHGADLCQFRDVFHGGRPRLGETRTDVSRVAMHSMTLSQTCPGLLPESSTASGRLSGRHPGV
jgi:hypothetical protein